MHLDESVCPHCLSRGAPASTRSAEGLVTCRDCHGAFAVQACGAAAIPLPDHIVVLTSRRRFAVVLKSFFVTFGAAPSDLVLQLDRERFSWPPPGDLGPLRFSKECVSVERSAIARFTWRRYTQRNAEGEHETISDLTLIGRSGTETRAGFAFPGRFVAGAAIATLLDWAHDTWFEAEGSVYRSKASQRARPEVAVLRRSGRIERLTPGEESIPSQP